MAAELNQRVDLSTFEAKRAWARESEIRVGEMLRARGWWVIPTYEFSGHSDDKAPKMLAPVGRTSLVLPDLQCFRDGVRRWFEVKRKTSATDYALGGYRTTGINARHFDHYVSVQTESKTDVCLVFVHEAEGEIRGQLIRNIERSFSHRYSGEKMGRGGMIFWKYDELPLWHAEPRAGQLNT